MRRHSSFLLRCWDSGGRERVEVEHIQSGTKVLVSSLAEAADWIASQRACADEVQQAGSPAPVPVTDEH
jgi:hypothetical protein